VIRVLRDTQAFCVLSKSEDPETCLAPTIITETDSARGLLTLFPPLDNPYNGVVMKDGMEVMRIVMNFYNQLELVLGIVSILGLLVIGFVVSVRSGDAGVSNATGFRLFLGTFSRVVIRVCGYIAGLAAVQQLIGFPTGLGW
jgi:hypothetical protein